MGCLSSDLVQRLLIVLAQFANVLRYIPVGHWSSAFDRLHPLFNDWRGDTNYRPDVPNDGAAVDVERPSRNEGSNEHSDDQDSDCCAKCLRKRWRTKIVPASGHANKDHANDTYVSACTLLRQLIRFGVA